MLSLIAMLLGTAILSSSVDSQCPMKCSVNILNKYPGNGYRASVTVVSPVWVRRRRRVVIRMKFDKLVKKVEHVHIVGGNLRRKGSNITRNEVRLLFRPQATIRKEKSKVKIEFILRAPANPPVLTEVRFWRKIACSNSGCPSSVTTAKPVITVKTTKRPEPATEEPEEKTTNVPATQPPIKTEKPEVTKAPEEKTTPASATEPPTKTEGPQVTEAPEEKSTPAPATEPPTTTERPQVTEAPEQKTTPGPATEPPIKTEGPPVTEAPEEKTTPVRATEPPIKTERPQVTEAPEQKTTPAPETEPPTRKPPTEAPEEKSTPAATEPSVIIGAV